MATYNKSLFGTKFYGPESDPIVPTSWDVNPVVAAPWDYTLMNLTWKSPVGDWTGLRVVKSYSGFAINENDGETLLDTASTTRSLLDGHVRPGSWHYYTIFVQSSGIWQRAGGATALMPRNNGYAERFYTHLPEYHQSTGVDLNDEPTPNLMLKKFFGVLAWGMDYMKTNLDSTQWVNDPSQTHLDNLIHLADELGIPYEASTPSRLFRQRVRNAANLGREKGTLEQMASLIGLTTSYTPSLLMSPNIMVSDDGASFFHPIYPRYNTGTNYTVGERVEYKDYIYQCLVPSYSLVQAPSGLATSNTWWTNLAGSSDSTLADSDGAIFGWEPLHYTGATNPTISMSLGLQSFRDILKFDTNALKLTNTTGATADIGVRSVPKLLGQSTTDSGQIYKFGTPIPLATLYDPTKKYERQSLVNYQGLTYRSFHEVIGVAPSGLTTDSLDWENIGLDDRVNMTFSLYAKGGSIVAAYPMVELFDELGKIIATVDTEREATPLFDAFGSRFGVLAGRGLDTGGVSWTKQTGTWSVTSGNGGVVWPLSTGLITVPGNADGNVSVTFVMEGSTGHEQYVYFRGTDATTYLKATRTALYSHVDTVDTLLGTYSTAFSDQDRMTVNFLGSAINVRRNGAVVLSLTSTVNQTATLHGLGVS